LNPTTAGDISKSLLSVGFFISDLQLDRDPTLRQQKAKIENTKRVLKLTKSWNKGYYNVWVDWLSIPLGLSTRKIREDYLDPLISKGIIKRTENNEVFWIGAPELNEV